MSTTANSFYVTGGTLRPDAPSYVERQADRVKLWHTVKQHTLGTLKGHAGIVDAVAFSPDGQTLASSGMDHCVKLWDIRVKQVVATLQGHRASVLAVTFPPDGTILASASMDTMVRLWRAASFAEADGAAAARSRRTSGRKAP
jgi:WD40 repeat protein